MLPALLTIAAIVMSSPVIAAGDDFNDTPSFASGSASNAENLSPDMRDAIEVMRDRLERAEDYIDLDTRDAARQKRDAVKNAMGGENGRLMKLAKKLDRSLGIKPSDGTLMIFVSHSMDDDFIKSYLYEAAWSGANVYVRGIPAGMNIHDYIFKKLQPVLTEKIGASVKINPKPFGLYGVTTVPTIVWDAGKQNTCTKGRTEMPTIDDKGDNQAVTRCRGTHEQFWKISGGVTVDYALRKFDEAGAKGAAERLEILRENVDPGSGQHKTQHAYTGDWENAPMPGDQIEGTGGVTNRAYQEPPVNIMSDTSTVEGKKSSP